MKRMTLTIKDGKLARMQEHKERLATAKPNSIAVKRPDLLEFWDWEKNSLIGLDPYNATCGMNRIAYWNCPDYPDHHYEKAIDSRVKSANTCPYCSGRRVLTGFNDLATTHPYLVKEWLYAVNPSDASPTTVSAGSHAVVRWRCTHHDVEWDAKVCDRSKGEGCKDCKSEKISAARSRVAPGNSLAEKFPDVAAEWDYELNDKTPEQVSAHAKERACFICNKHDEPYRWSAEIHTRTGKLKAGCPKCGFELSAATRKAPVEGGSLADLYPNSLKEWDYDLNGDVTPYNVRPCSQQVFNWRCSICGDTWSTTIGNRTQRGVFKLGCRKCKNSKVNYKKLRPRSKGYLEEARPDIAIEWDHAKNKKLLSLSLEHISVSSNLDVWWICPKGHSYHATVNHRTSRGDGCSVCAVRSHVSFPEKAIFYYVSQAFGDAKENAKPKIDDLGHLELDIWIPSIRVAIEYDGHYWHSDTARDVRKDSVCANADIKLIRIREQGCPIYNTSATLIERETVYDDWSLDKAINALLLVLGKGGVVDVSVGRDAPAIRSAMNAPNGIVPFANVPIGGQFQLNLAC